LQYPELDVVDVIGREHMKESPLYQEILAEGRQEGLLEARRADILEALQIHFGIKAAARFEKRLRSIRDPEVLSRLHRLAIQSKAVVDFQHGLEAETNGA